jgi:hypothetical protein
MVLLCVLFNFGALILTNAMVAKQAGGNIRFVELNPVAENLHGYEGANETMPAGSAYAGRDATDLFVSFMKQAVLLSLPAAIYVYMRRTVSNIDVLNAMMYVITYMVLILAFDFFHDFGFWTGRWAH